MSRNQADAVYRRSPVMAKTSAAHATPAARTASRKTLVNANMMTCMVSSRMAVHAV